MAAGIISSTPVWVPLAAGGAALGCGYGGYRLLKLKRKLNETPQGEEAQSHPVEVIDCQHTVEQHGAVVPPAATVQRHPFGNIFVRTKCFELPVDRPRPLPMFKLDRP